MIFHHFKKKCIQTLKIVNLEYPSFNFFLISTVRYNFSLNPIKIFKIPQCLFFKKKFKDSGMDIFVNSVKF